MARTLGAQIKKEYNLKPPPKISQEVISNEIKGSSNKESIPLKIGRDKDVHEGKGSRDIKPLLNSNVGDRKGGTSIDRKEGISTDRKGGTSTDRKGGTSSDRKDENSRDRKEGSSSDRKRGTSNDRKEGREGSSNDRNRSTLSRSRSPMKSDSNTSVNIEKTAVLQKKLAMLTGTGVSTVTNGESSRGSNGGKSGESNVVKKEVGAKSVIKGTGDKGTGDKGNGGKETGEISSGKRKNTEPSVSGVVSNVKSSGKGSSSGGDKKRTRDTSGVDDVEPGGKRPREETKTVTGGKGLGLIF